MDCCTVDGKNPYIVQASVLAIKNLMENNAHNQDILRAMEAKGKVDHKTLADIGIELSTGQENS